MPPRSHPLRHVDEYLAIGQQAGASDIHLGVNAPPIWRLHGTLQPIWLDAPRFTSGQTLALAEGFLSNQQKVQLSERGDADFAHANSFGRYRTSLVRQRRGVDLVFRIINTKARTMDELVEEANCLPVSGMPARGETPSAPRWGASDAIANLNGARAARPPAPRGPRLAPRSRARPSWSPERSRRPRRRPRPAADASRPGTARSVAPRRRGHSRR